MNIGHKPLSKVFQLGIVEVYHFFRGQEALRQSDCLTFIFGEKIMEYIGCVMFLCYLRQQRNITELHAPMPSQDSRRQFQRHRSDQMQPKIHSQPFQSHHATQGKRRILPRPLQRDHSTTPGHKDLHGLCSSLLHRAGTADGTDGIIHVVHPNHEYRPLN